MNLRLVLGDHLSREISSLSDLGPEDRVLMVEVRDEITRVAHHKQKIALVLAAMRHFAEELRDEGIAVDYVRLDDPENTQSFEGELHRYLAQHEVACITLTEPSEWQVWSASQDWDFGVPVDVREDTRFLCSHSQFKTWAEGRKSYRMEYFYREMRRRFGWLMDGDEPEGGSWNYDVRNRKSLPVDHRVAPRADFTADSVTKEVLALVAEEFGDNFGELDGFRWAVTRSQAREALSDFLENHLEDFGAYQDAMRTNEDFVHHAILSPYINLGLLLPAEVCEATVDAYRRGAPLESVEGFIRQVAGWREFVRGLYWMHMPAYAETNALEATRELPDMYWSGNTDMKCMNEAIRTTKDNAYAHHIQRLMITGNFALLAGINPAEVENWYLCVYADAFEWVELPNTHGMALFADGGILASKPYAASGAYINRMSDYCKSCPFNPKKRTGVDACPFNYLYWSFLDHNEPRLRGNPRMAMAYRNLDRIEVSERKEMAGLADDFLDSVGAR